MAFPLPIQFLRTLVYSIFISLDIISTENYNLNTCLEGIRILKSVSLSVGSAQGDFLFVNPFHFLFTFPESFPIKQWFF